jgi:hypothetical protein
VSRFALDDIPDPLEDPLRAMRKFFGWLFVIQVLFAFGLIIIALFAKVDEGLIGTLIVGVVGSLVTVPLMFAFWRVLPNRSVSAVYLRSFSHDRETGAIRTALQSAFGRKFRLSGIRDPRRRWPKFLRYLAVFAFAIRYSTPKYMSLEAGDDWKRRLWRSLGDARCAIIDVTDLTPYVVEEIRLCHKCLGLDRILFVGDTSKSADEWKEAIDRVLGWESQSQRIRLAIWDESRAGRKMFTSAARQFASQVPVAPAGFRPEAADLVKDGSLENEPRERSSGVWVELIVGFLLAGAFSVALEVLFKIEALGDIRFLLLLPVLAIYLITAYHFLVYLIECGSNRERVLATLSIGLAVGTVVLVFWSLIAAVHKVREAAARMVSNNNLKQIGIAFQDYESENRRFPAANAPARRWDAPRSPRPPVSWRVLILPHLFTEDGTALYNAYRQDEPWDSPNNIKLLERMPKVYRHPAAPNTPAGYTHYRVFVSPRNAPDQAIFTDGQDGPSIRAITDGTANTILVVEANEAVPWTKPDELIYDPKQPLPKLGGHFSGGFNAVLADGSTRFVWEKTPESALRALITRASSDDLPKDW